MSAVPPKHPKKKRRLDASQEPQPGPSSGGATRPMKRCLRRVKKKSLHSCTNAKPGLPSDPPCPEFMKASEILKAVHSSSSSEEDEDVRMAKSSKYRNKDALPSAATEPSPPSPGFVKASEMRKAACSPSRSAASSSEDEDVQPIRRSKRQYGEMPLSSNLKNCLLEHFKDPMSPEFIRASEILKTLNAPSSSSTEDEDENVQAARSSKCPNEEVNPSTGSKPVSLLPKESSVDSVCGHCSLSNVNVPSGSKSNSEINHCKKWKSRAPNKRRKTNVPCNSSKITKYFLASDKTECAKTEKEAKKKKTISSSKVHKTRRNAGWDKKNEDLLETITDNELFFKRYQDRYGLVENSIEEDTGEDYFSSLPTHIIEMILCTVPMIDFINCRLVCRRWMDIIDNPQFMKWKKTYHKYKRDHYKKEAYLMVRRALAVPLNHQAVDGCISTLVNFMGKEFNRLPSTDMYDLLLQNPHGELADHVLKERFPEWNGKDSRVWCELCVAVLICETVWDILKLYQSLLTCKSNCLRTDVHDALYCVALFLLYFRCMENINSGLHYRLYYALYVIENNIPLCQRGKVQRVKNIPGQQSIQNYGESDDSALTYEQIRILNHRFDLNQKIKIVALAGSGKTTTLVHLARLYPQIKFLNIVFNKSVNREAKRKFPSNVVCKTAHAIAYDAVGRELRHKLSAVIRPYDLIGHMSHNEEHLQIYLYGKLVLATISDFMYSGDKTMSLQHVPFLDPDERPISSINRDRILMDAYKIWQKMGDSMSDIRITHDVYLKLYQLSKPKLDEFQCIMVDEAQDCNPAILDIVMSQSIPVILVGDPHQQIYAFRGAQNALQLTRATHTYGLTKSFRFGPQISYMASCVLEVSLSLVENPLIGNTTDSNLRGETSGQFAVIARSNVVLFNEAIRMVVLKRLKPHEPQNVQPFFAGGLASYGFDQMLDIYMLKFLPRGERKLKDKFISRFKTLHDLYTYAKFSNDKDLKSKIELVNQHGHDIPNFLVNLKQRCSPSMQSATVVFTTAHKSKGLEFDTVSLTEDYVISPTTGEQTVEEANILYVAITRAKKCLLLPEKVTKLLHAAHEKFEYPVSSKALLKDGVELKCVQCDSVFVPHTVLALVRRKTVMASGREVSEGPLCMKCRSDPTMRPDVHLNGLVMYLDPIPDNSHRVMNSLVGPLPSDPPIVHDRFNEFANADRVFVINLNIH